MAGWIVNSFIKNPRLDFQSLHHTVRDEETTVVSLSKIQPNSACQEARMTFGAVKAIKRFLSYASAL